MNNLIKQPEIPKHLLPFDEANRIAELEKNRAKSYFDVPKQKELTPKDVHELISNYKRAKQQEIRIELRDRINAEECINQMYNLIEVSKICEIKDLERVNFQLKVCTTLLKLYGL